MERKFKPVKVVLFDLDGLVLNTEAVYEKVFHELCEKYGKKLTTEVRVKLLGSSERKACDYCVANLQLKVSPDQFYSEFRELSQQRLETVEFLPGAVRLIQHLHARQIPICVASGSSDESIRVKTRKHQEVFALFHHITKGTDPGVEAPKPAPFIFLTAAGRFEPKADPADCLVFEDAPNGVQAALAAGMQVVMVPADYISDEQKNEGTLWIKSLEDFQPDLFGLPPYE